VSDWLQLTLRTDSAGLEQIEAGMLDSGALAVTYRDAQDQPLLEPAPGEMPLWRDLLITGLYPRGSDPQAIAARLCAQLDWERLPADAFDALPDRLWERAWLDDFKPMRFGERLWVVPSAFQPPQPEAVNLRLDPGLAFGTGNHPTTALCLEWLDAADLGGATLIDYGCGSGVLAIAALLLGAERVIATDIDPQALRATGSNAAANGVAERLNLCTPDDLPQHLRGAGGADVLVANILAGPLLQLAPRIAELSRPGGALLLCGLLAEQAAQMSERYAHWYRVDKPVIRGDWARLSAVRRGSSDAAAHG